MMAIHFCIPELCKDVDTIEEMHEDTKGSRWTLDDPIDWPAGGVYHIEKEEWTDGGFLVIWTLSMDSQVKSCYRL